MSEVLNVRPSLRRAKFSAVLCVLFFAVVVWAKAKLLPDAAWWLIVVGVLPFVAPLLAYVDSIRTRLWLEEGLVRFRHGFLVQTTRAMELRKIQDVRVERTLSQRMWGVGTLILESAGESSRLVIADIDNPQAAAETILRASRKEGISRENV